MSRYGLKVIAWDTLDAAARARVLARPVIDTGAVREAVAAILAAVRARGDEALREFSRRYDAAAIDAIEVPLPDAAAAERSLPRELARALRAAIERIRAFHAADVPAGRTVRTGDGLECRVVYRPVSPVGLYVPGGSAPLLSTVPMLAVPAQLAGCREIVLCSPPGRDGTLPPAILAAASLCGVQRAFRIGGAQAIAAMAYGSESVPRCHKIFGPGNAWVTEAKQQVSLDPEGAAIDLPAGPSEVMVIADAAALADGGTELIAWDLLAQAEHGPDSQVLLATDSRELAVGVIQDVERLAPTASRAGILDLSLRSARILLVRDIDLAIGIANRYAPEHLILHVDDARDRAQQIDHAGSVFIGRWTPESLGDYCSGTNHVLPTHGWARSHGALGVGDFMRRMTLQESSRGGLAIAGPDAETLAEFEGLEAHRMAISARLARAGSPA